MMELAQRRARTPTEGNSSKEVQDQKTANNVEKVCMKVMGA